MPLAMPTDNLKDRFRICDLGDGELEVLLQKHFRSSRAVSLKEVIYPHDKSNYAVKIQYNAAGRVGDICPGPALDTTEIEIISRQIQDDLLRDQGTGIGRVILFASVRCAGFFRYKDTLQILPVPGVAPLPPTLMGEWPFVLEWQFPKSSNQEIENYRRLTKERRYELLIAGLLPYSIRSFRHTARYHWVLQRSQEAGTGDSECKYSYLQEGYSWEGLRLLDREFSNPAADNVPTLDLTERHDFYSHDGISVNQRMEMPSSMNDLLDTFFSLQADDQERFLRASFWSQHAQIVSSYSLSAAFTALISGIESLILDKAERCDGCSALLSSAKCPKCGKSIERITQAFKEFVERFGKHSDTKEEERDRLYKMRSKLSHGGLLFPSDVNLYEGLNKRIVEEWLDIRTARKILSVILVEWLKDQDHQKGLSEEV